MICEGLMGDLFRVQTVWLCVWHVHAGSGSRVGVLLRAWTTRPRSSSWLCCPWLHFMRASRPPFTPEHRSSYTASDRSPTHRSPARYSVTRSTTPDAMTRSAFRNRAWSIRLTWASG